VTYPAIPTKYAGIDYRSRLEARWAAFFDRIGWQYTYEPFDGAGYIPDFLIHGESPLLVEVKPVVTAAEFEAATAKVVRGLAGVWQHDVLIVGADPLPQLDYCARFFPGGWLGEFGHSCGTVVDDGKHWTWLDSGKDACWCGKPLREPWWAFGSALWFTCTACNAVGVHHMMQCWNGRPCGHRDGGGYLGLIDKEWIRAAWADASNAVRWESR
jgi:hypothetical protein